MKTLIIGIAAGLFCINASAQNTNVTEVSKTTVITTKDSDGVKKAVVKQNTQEVQNIELQNAESKELNKDLKASPVQVISTTEVTGTDGMTRTLDVDRSAYYSVGGAKYRVAVDNTGYSVMEPTSGKKTAILRRTSNNNYIYRTADKTSFGYFDKNGNLVLETYDDKTDKITVETYIRN